MIYPNPWLPISTAQSYGARPLAGGHGVWLFMTCMECDQEDKCLIRCDECQTAFCTLCYMQHDHEQDEPGDRDLTEFPA